MKRTILLTLMLLCTSLGIWAQEDDASTEVKITFDPTSLDFSAEGDEKETVTITLEGATEWLAFEENDWIEIDKKNGADGDIVTVTVGKYDGSEPRTGKITFSAGEGENMRSSELTITQEGKETLESFITFSPETLDVFPAEGGIQNVTITHNVEEWQATAEEDAKKWIHFTENGKSGDDIIITVDPNLGGVRTATITISSGTTEESLKVTQKAAETTFTIMLEGQKIGELNFKETKGEKTVAISSNLDWETSIEYDGTSNGWLSLDKPSGTSGDNQEVIISVEANTTGESRTATITFTSVNGNNTISETIIVTQDGKPYIEIDPQDDQMVSEKSDTIDISVDSNITWDAKSSEEWIKVNIKDETSLEIIIDENPGKKERTGSVSIIAGTETRTINITQKGQPYIKIEPQEDQIVSEIADNLTVKIESNREWEIIISEKDQSWIEVDPNSRDGNQEVTVIVKENDETDQRSGTVTFMVNDEIFKTLTITQLGKPYITINPEELKDVSEDGMTTSISVESNRDWKAVDIPSWIILPKDGNADNTTIDISIIENSDTTIRVATIKFVADKDVKTLIISQKGQPFIKVKSGLDKLKNVSENGDKVTITIESNVEWNTSSTIDWISTEKVSLTELNITIEPNPYKTDRNMNITLEIDKSPIDITISQNGAKYEIKDIEWENSVELKDVNNSTNKLKEGIRSGNTLQLPKEKMKPQMTGVGVDYYKWKYEYNWSLDNKSFNGDNVSIPYVNTKTVIKLECKAVLKDPSGTIVDSQTIYSREVVVYPKPSANLSLQKKGDGTSNTWIVQNFTKSENERLVIGLYNETSNSVTYKGAISEYSNGVGWIKLSLADNGSEKPCICIVHDYGNDVKITSDVYLENGTKSWDGSTYSKHTETQITRGGFDATKIENVENNGQIEEPINIFSINGTQTNKMVRGMNIIRMKDGSVRKVFVK